MDKKKIRFQLFRHPKLLNILRFFREKKFQINLTDEYFIGICDKYLKLAQIFAGKRFCQQQF